MKNIIELAKKNYKERKQIKRLRIEKVFIRGLNRHSDTIFIANGKRVILTKYANNDYDFVIHKR